MAQTLDTRDNIYPRNGTLHDGQYIKRVPSPFSTLQISQWLSRIKFPTKYSDSDITSGAISRSLENLELLTMLHLAAFPYENTDMHYTRNHSMDVSWEGSFQRLVLDGNGSYCYGLNSVFLGMLRGLGYRAYSGGARVNLAKGLDTPDFTSLAHMVILVQPFEESNKTYMIDVGFGSTGPVRPILLSSAEDNVVLGATPAEKHRLTRRAYPLSSLETAGEPSTGADSDLSWNLEVWLLKGSEAQSSWRMMYSFTENECFPIDAEDASFVVSQKPGSKFWNNVICTRYVRFDDAVHLDEEGKAQIALECGQYPEDVRRKFMLKYMLFGGEVKRCIGRSYVTIRSLTTELERIQALREIFGLDIPDAAQIHIVGRNAALGS